MQRSDQRIQIRAAQGRTIRGGFTLIEMMIAMALTLVLVYALAEFFSIVGDSVRDSRATVEMSGQLRAVALRLHQDLQWRTAEAVPWSDQLRAPGYIEYQEGPASDLDPENNGIDANGNGTNDQIEDLDGNRVPDIVQGTFDANSDGNPDPAVTNLLGDGDDFLALTIEARGDDFQGRVNGATQRSRFAEVVWFSGYQDLDGSNGWTPEEPRVLIRRQLLIIPSLGTIASNLTYADAERYFQNYDLSMRIVQSAPGQYNLIANSLSDLSRREHRYGHNPGFPGALRITLPAEAPSTADASTTYVLGDFSSSGGSDNRGEDVMISNLLAFDLRAFSPSVPVHADATANAAEALLPGDPGYQVARGTNQIAAGGYVDLNYNRYLSGAAIVNATNVDLFAGGPNTYSGLTTPAYDTWALSYELDPAIGNGAAFNGIDDPDRDTGMLNTVIDDYGERRTRPPYNAPLRGLRARVRIYDPGSRIVRQVTVDSDFIAE